MTRQQITKHLLQKFMRAIGQLVQKHATFYVTGGATALLYDFRESTIDIDIAGDMDAIFSHIPRLKTSMNINIEMAKPTDFVPCLQGEQSRHVPINTFGKVSFLHFDLYAQAFSKIVRGHQTDIRDVKALIAAGLVDARKLSDLVRQLSDQDYEKYPRLNRVAVQAAIESFVQVHTP